MVKYQSKKNSPYLFIADGLMCNTNPDIHRLGKMCGMFFFALNLVLFGVFAFVQCFNPLIYGLWIRELQSKLYHWVYCQLWCGHDERQRASLNQSSATLNQ